MLSTPQSISVLIFLSFGDILSLGSTYVGTRECTWPPSFSSSKSVCDPQENAERKCSAWQKVIKRSHVPWEHFTNLVTHIIPNIYRILKISFDINMCQQEMMGRQIVENDIWQSFYVRFDDSIRAEAGHRWRLCLCCLQWEELDVLLCCCHQGSLLPELNR